jgi:transcriptional regulator with XRE-family HTH domain
MKYERVNIGHIIEHKLNELGISKTEFGNRIGVANQNVNRIFEKKSIDINKLMEISEALEYDFFQYFKPIDITTDISKNSSNEIEILKTKIHRLEGENNILREMQGLEKKGDKNVG